MKSILSTTCLLAFAINMVFSFEYIHDNFDCGNITVAQLCVNNIKEFVNKSNPKKDLNVELTYGEENVVTIRSYYTTYNSCAEFRNEIASIGNCKTCNPIHYNSTNTEDCIETEKYEEDED